LWSLGRWSLAEWREWVEQIDGEYGKWSNVEWAAWLDQQEAAQDAFKSISLEPAQGQPAQGSQIAFVLSGRNAKERAASRTLLRSQMKKQKLDRSRAKFVSAIVPPPPICNRVAVGWKEPCQACHCEDWPQFISQNLRKQDNVVVIEECIDADGVLGRPSADMTCQYWRPSGSKGGKWWYNGKANALYRVRYPTGVTKNIVSLN
jgi:hypothetical protein